MSLRRALTRTAHEHDVAAEAVDYQLFLAAHRADLLRISGSKCLPSVHRMRGDVLDADMMIG